MKSKRLVKAALSSIPPSFNEETVGETETVRMLTALDPDRRARVAASCKVDPHPVRIALKLLEPGRVESGWTAADAIGKILLRAASAAPKLIGKGTLVRCALDRRHSPAEIEQRLASLEAEGLLLWRDTGLSSGYAVPSEIAVRLRAAARAEMSGPNLAARPPGPATDHGGAFLDDVVTTLAFLKRGAYRVTRGGAVHAADLRRLGARLVYPEEVPGSTEQPATGSEPFPTRMGLALDLVRRLLLVRFEPDEVRVDEKRVKSWLDRPADEVRRDLFRAASREPWRHQREVSAVADFLAENPPGRWIFIEDVARALEYHPDFVGCRPDQLRARVQSGATYLCYLGAVALSPEEVRPDAVALTSLGARLLSDEPPGISAEAQARPLHLLPTFEVILDASAPLGIRYALEVFADPEPAGQGPVRRYRLEKRTLLQAMRGGLALADALGFLQRHADPVPENVRVSFEEWSRAYGEYYFMQATLLVCRDAVAAAAARSDPKIAERILGQLTPEILVLEETSIEPVRAALEANGSMPKAGVEAVPAGGGPPPAKAPDARAAAVSAIARFVREREERKAAPHPIVAALGGIAPEDRPADAPDPSQRSKLCSVEGCGRPHVARGWCTLHYQAARRGKLGSV